MSTVPNDDEMINEAGARGLDHGWDAANYADAYGSKETRDKEAHRRAGEEYRFTAQHRERWAYESGFLDGWDNFTDSLWQDGSPRGDDND